MIPTPTPTIPIGGITPTSVREAIKDSKGNQPSHLEEALTKLTINTNAFIEETRSNFKNQREAIKKVEVQVGDLAKQLQQLQHKTPNVFPGNTIMNPNA
ncbi:hypothetical protein PIB30_073543 [Stylosanthes scabra]|uniref:Uncharacterized protein n=1 Tax=Stylosanthes scabra TaxID=79078 RepID=A0ABU6XP54_9FABA|nr:hypothetical protein [Stylosanthes scabra]